MFWKCRRFANLQSVKQYCINKLQNLVVLTQWQRVHVSVRCAQSWRESHERRTHFLKTGVTIDLWVSDVIVYCSQLFMRSGKLKPWTTRIAYGQKCHVSESYKFKNNIKNLNQSIILFVNCPVYGFQKFSVSFKWTILTQVRLSCNEWNILSSEGSFSKCFLLNLNSSFIALDTWDCHILGFRNSG